MLFFRGEGGRSRREDAKNGEVLRIDEAISTKDIERVGDGYWLVKATNFDRKGRTKCKLRIEYPTPK